MYNLDILDIGIFYLISHFILNINDSRISRNPKKQIGDLNQIHPTEDFKVFSLVKCPICNQTLQISLDLDLIDKKIIFHSHML